MKPQVAPQAAEDEDPMAKAWPAAELPERPIGLRALVGEAALLMGEVVRPMAAWPV